MDLTFAHALTPAGIVAVAALITGFIALLKQAIPKLDAAVSGALMAFVLTLFFYAGAAVFTGASTPDALLAVFVAWMTCATAAVGIHSVASHVTGNPTYVPDPARRFLKAGAKT